LRASVSRTSRGVDTEPERVVFVDPRAARAAMRASPAWRSAAADVVGRRTKEIGIRMALGAERRGVMRLVLRQGAAMTGIGICAGLAGAAASTRYLESLLLGLAPLGVPTYAVAAAALAAAALLASYLPARRATSIDPLAALRHQ
jgi:ABC-type antimicrobial peptide transport system permease subunit